MSYNSQRSNLLASIVLVTLYYCQPFPYIHNQIHMDESATVLGQLPDCLLGDCDIRYIYHSQLSAVYCQCQHTLLCHLIIAPQCDLLQVRAAACQLS